MDAGPPERLSQRPEGRKKARDTASRNVFRVDHGCFARARVFHALQHYVARLEARVKTELIRNWTARCDHILVCLFIASVQFGGVR